MSILISKSIRRKDGKRVKPQSSIEEMEMERLWRPVFDKYDHDHDGKVPLDELKGYLCAANKYLEGDVPKNVIDEIIERSDWDHNRYLTYPEFLRMIHAYEIESHRPRVQRLIRYASVLVTPKSQRHTVVNRYFDEYNCNPPPLFLISASIIEIVIFAYYCIMLGDIGPSGPVPFESVLIYNPYRRYEIWRYLTYALMHAGYFHILFNIIVQLALGIPLELVHKGWRIGILYLCGCIAGSLGSSLADPKTFLLGASGGVYTLIAAHVANVALNFQEMEFGVYRILILVFFGTTDISLSVYDRYSSTSKNRTSYIAHLFGALTGVLLGVIALRNLRRRKWEVFMQWIFGILWLLLIGFCIIWNIANPDYFPEQQHE